MRIVLDANVIIAAFAARGGLCASVMELCLQQHHILLCDQILDEVARNLAAKIKLPASRIRGIVAFLKSQAAVHKPAALPAGSCRDIDDVAILGTALASQADAIVTGDRDLLSLGEFRGCRIISPRDFWTQRKNSAP